MNFITILNSIIGGKPGTKLNGMLNMADLKRNLRKIRKFFPHDICCHVVVLQDGTVYLDSVQKYASEEIEEDEHQTQQEGGLKHMFG